MANVWIDLTEMAEWTGHLTGIPRVVVSIGSRRLDDPTSRFCVADPVRGFVEVPRERAREILSVDAVRVAVPVDTRVPLSRRAFAPVRRVVLGLGRRSPAPVKRVLVGAYSRLRPHPVVIHPRDLAHPFADGDVLLVLGPSWARPAFTLALGAIRRSTRLGVIHVVYDLIPVLFPQFFGPHFGSTFLREMVNVMSVSDRLIAISENTAKDVHDFQQEVALAPVPVTPVLLGSDLPLAPSAGRLEGRIRGREFVLCVGSFEVRKNHLLLYNTWRAAAEAGRELPLLVIAGKKGFLTGDLAYLIENDPRVANSILWIPDANDSELAWLYLSCVLTVYPSWYEGWGLPIVESLAVGKLALVARTSSMPEAGGDFAEYFDPHSVAELDALLQYWLGDRDALAAVQRRIREQYRPFTWDESFAQVEAVVTELRDDLTR